MEIKEDKVIEEIKKYFRPHPRIVVGPGDDAILVSEIPGRAFVVSIDCQKEGIHFRRDFLSLEEIGHRALAASLSDLAAMVASPLTFLVDLEVPPDFGEGEINRIYSGFDKLSQEFCLSPSGGNLVRGEKLSLSIAVLGELPKERKILRSGSKPGDIVVLTGDLGRVEAALRLLKNKGRYELVPLYEERIIEKFRRPWPRIKEMELIQKEVQIRGAIDISDGLGIDLFRLARESNVEILVWQDALPVEECVKEFCRVAKVDEFELVAMSGEEFEVAFTMDPEEFPKIEPLGVRKIGVVRAAFEPDVKMKMRTGEERSVASLGYDQLKR